MWWHFSAADAREADWLRPAFLHYLRARGAEDADYMAAEMIFGELIGNVVRHAPGEISIRVDWRPGERPLLCVSDRGPGFRLAPVLPDDIFAETGRGLFLVRAFAHSLSVQRRPGGGSTVRARLQIAPGPARRGAPGADVPAYAATALSR